MTLLNVVDWQNAPSYAVFPNFPAIVTQLNRRTCYRAGRPRIRRWGLGSINHNINNELIQLGRHHHEMRIQIIRFSAIRYKVFTAHC
jgi:hypothetical protein